MAHVGSTVTHLSSDLERSKEDASQPIPDPSAGNQLPYLFLDVDGVLNAFDLDTSLGGFDDFVGHEIVVDNGTGFRMFLEVLLSLEMGRRISALPVEIIWLTTWGHDADLEIAPRCGLPGGLPVITTPSEATGNGSWKVGAVMEVLDRQPRPFVWVDDDLDDIRARGKSARELVEELNLPGLLVAPDPRTGLIPEQLESIEAFVSQASRE